MPNRSRRDFLKHSMTLGAAAMTAGPWSGVLASAAESAVVPAAGAKMKLGLVTYLWGQDWDLPTLIANCEKTGILGVELRTEHKHGVEPKLDAAARREVKKRFADSPVVNVGPGTNQAFDDPDPAKLRKSIDVTKAFVLLSRDTGGSGVKVKPNDLQKGIDPQQTIQQIGKSLNEVGKFAADEGQQIRLEVHGSCGPLPIIKQIMDVADNPNVTVCWNCNGDELKAPGLEHYFDMVKGRFGAAAHVRELDDASYPYQDLIRLFAKMDYDGWILLECRTKQEDRIKALIQQREIFQKMVANAK